MTGEQTALPTPAIALRPSAAGEALPLRRGASCGTLGAGNAYMEHDRCYMIDANDKIVGIGSEAIIASVNAYGRIAGIVKEAGNVL